MALLAPHDPAPVEVLREDGESDLVLVCDHAGHAIPAALGDLGVPEHERLRHIGWDIGAMAVARIMSARLDAPLVAQRYSRLVIDSNRRPDSPTAMPEVSETTEIPGNRGLSAADREARAAEILVPYHQAITRLLDARRAARRRTILIAVHSFTPRFKGVDRPWHIGVLYNRDPRVGHALRPLLEAEPGLVVGDNEPYAVDDATDYTIPIHGEQRGLPHVEIEMRQDLLLTEAGQEEWADRLCRLLPAACRAAGV